MRVWMPLPEPYKEQTKKLFKQTLIKKRISYLENLICPCESHDYVEIKRDYFPNSHGGKEYFFICARNVVN